MEKLFSISNKLLLAPMVRLGSTPFRVLCLRHGADYVFTEEIIAYKLVSCERIYNADLNTFDYVSKKDKSTVLRVSEAEKGRLFLQIGAADRKTALEAALIV